MTGQTITFTATITPVSPGNGTPTGTVTFKEGTVTVGTGAVNGSTEAAQDTSFEQMAKLQEQAMRIVQKNPWVDQFGTGTGGFSTERTSKYDVKPAGNAVNLEDEMMKVAANQMDHQAAISLYSRSMGLLKTAIGKK